MVDQRYQDLKNTLLERDLSRYNQPRETISIPYLLKGQCGTYATALAGLFPELKVVKGFYNGMEHIWCQHEDGSIIDPTVEQFYVPEWGGDPTLYKVWDEEVDKVYLGKCMNCGIEIYGLKKEGYKDICGDECAESLTAYLNQELSYRR